MSHTVGLFPLLFVTATTSAAVALSFFRHRRRPEHFRKDVMPFLIVLLANAIMSLVLSDIVGSHFEYIMRPPPYAAWSSPSLSRIEQRVAEGDLLFRAHQYHRAFDTYCSAVLSLHELADFERQDPRPDTELFQQYHVRSASYRLRLQLSVIGTRIIEERTSIRPSEDCSDGE
jgi:hypothetical protein